MKKFFLQLHERMGILTILVIGLCMISFGLLANSFALSQPVPRITFSSKKLSYTEKKPGSWNVEKSAEWINEGKARITFQVDSTLMASSKYTDVIFVLDISGSMSGEKLDRVKEDSKELVTSLLSDPHNQAALITFDIESELVSGFTKNKDELITKIDQLTDKGSTNYYQPLVHVDSLLKDYQKKEDTECVVLFLTDGFPNQDVPNQISEYEYLKSTYPWLNIHGVQYEMGEEILNPIKEISDEQFIADMDTLNNVLFDASVVPIPYDNFILTDFINNTYFNLDDVSQIKASFGTVKLMKENGVPKVTWDLSGLKSGQSASLTIDIDLKEEYLSQEGIYPTNKSSEVTSKIETNEENVTTNESPSLQTYYQVIYEGNAPSGCTVSEVPKTTSYLVFSTVAKSDEVATCEGYQFKGWMVVTEGVETLNDDYFKMPEKDVTLRAEWGKMTISKSMSGTVYTKPIPKLQKVGSKEKLWQYKDSITKIVISNDINPPEGSTSNLTWDISYDGRGGVMGYLVPTNDGTNTYIAYIQGVGEIIANEDSSYLFAGFKKLTTIEGLELLDTSQVTNMGSMFYGCSMLESLNLSEWSTSQVTNMGSMFYYCSSLTNLDVSHFVTDNVTDMSYMFNSCSSLTSLDLGSWNTSKVENMYLIFTRCSQLMSLNLSGWDTSNVINMFQMFFRCTNLSSLDLSGWDTPQVITMDSMFSDCSSLTNLNLSGWNTSKVISIGSMFYNCSNLKSLDLSGWNTSQVSSMYQTFYNCSNLTSLDLSGWDTSQVTNMSSTFYYCNKLTALNLSEWDTPQVITMDSMFSDCSSLTNLNLSGWNTSKVISIGSMFYNCSNLKSLDLSGWNTSQVSSMYQTFYNCSNLTSLDLSGWDTSQVTNMSFMFYNCPRLMSLDLSTWKINTENVNVTNIFYGYGKTASDSKLNLSNWSFSNIRQDINTMFGGRIPVTELIMHNCQIENITSLSGLFSGLSTIKKMDLSNWNVSSVTDFSGMFSGCSQLTNLDLSEWDTSKAKSMTAMFASCSQLKILDLSSWKTSQVTDMSAMFASCSQLTNLDLSGWDTSNVTNMSSMFAYCLNLTTTINILNPSMTSYSGIFFGAATADNAKITVGYTSETASLVDQIIATSGSSHLEKKQIA